MRRSTSCEAPSEAWLIGRKPDNRTSEALPIVCASFDSKVHSEHEDRHDTSAVNGEAHSEIRSLLLTIECNQKPGRTPYPAGVERSQTEPVSVKMPAVFQLYWTLA